MREMDDMDLKEEIDQISRRIDTIIRQVEELGEPSPGKKTEDNAQ